MKSDDTATAGTTAGASTRRPLTLGDLPQFGTVADVMGWAADLAAHRGDPARADRIREGATLLREDSARE